MRLAPFISANIEPILAAWEEFARSVTSGSKLGQLALRDDAESILLSIVRDMGSDQSLLEQASKSKGRGGAGGLGCEHLDHASVLHGISRVESGFNLVEVVAEYRALRASVLSLWRDTCPEPDLNNIDDITRFNECIDQSLAIGVASYAERVDQTRRMFLAILAHDLRSPLNTISLSSQLAASEVSGTPDSHAALLQIETSVKAISSLISDLTDFASTGLGGGMPISHAPVELEALCHEVAGETQAAHPEHKIVCDVQGELTLVADGARLRQMMSNLLGNAIQYGSQDSPVRVSVTGEDCDVVISVQNGGEPIPAELMPTIFDPLVRGHSPAKRRPGSIGLGLYIVREIVIAHGGCLDVNSSKSEGTLFSARIPRCPPAA